MDAPPTVRSARPTDFETLRAIEVAAGARFREIGMPEIADDDPMSDEVLAAYADGGRSWVAVDSDGLPLGYAVVDVVEGCAHLEQISVDPARQGKGVGRALIAEIERWARSNNMDAVTLATFVHVPWNAPLYAHLGFRALREDELTPGLKEIVQREAVHGLDMKERVCMRRDVP
ncbi:MAG: GNAT family N-acetyltransferase [Actinomycetota bacterium]|nr:GNAT family N-acetyltransferase [Actinomycetota bacterium]